MDTVLIPLSQRGRLFLAIANTNRWTPVRQRMKNLHVRSPKWMRPALSGTFIAYKTLRGLAKDLLLFHNPLDRFRARASRRGMSLLHDWINLLGSHPFETALPEEVFNFYRQRGLKLKRLRTANGGYGNNEFVFRKMSV